MTIDIAGKTYTAKRISAIVHDQILATWAKFSDLAPNLDQEKNLSEYSRLWLKLCGLFLESSGAELSLDSLSAEDGKRLSDFFGQSLQMARTNTKNGNELSQST